MVKLNKKVVEGFDRGQKKERDEVNHCGGKFVNRFDLSILK